MKIVVSGKGGVGKTTLSGTLAKLFSDKGYKVIAVDSDPAMNLHTSMGMENPPPIFEFKDLIKERTVISNGVYNLNPKVEDIPDLYSSQKGNIKLIVMGTIEKGGEGCICPENAFLKALLRHMILKRNEFLILDTEAGLEHLGRNTAEKFDLMLVLIEPSNKAIETANRIYNLSKEIGIKEIYGIGNKVSSKEQEDFISSHTKFKVMAFIPFDDIVTEADMRNLPLVEHDANSKALKAMEKISDELLRKYNHS